MHIAAYHVPNWEINNIGVRSHKPPYATFRGPGKGPAIFIMESMMDHLARSLNLDIEEVKRMNLYTMGQVYLSEYLLTNTPLMIATNLGHTYGDDPKVLQHFFPLES
jgi:CO/xanthine dehydrogenase Mo-binding subunit